MGTGTDGVVALNRDLWEKLLTIPGVHVSMHVMVYPGHSYLTATFEGQRIADGHTYVDNDGKITGKSSYTLTATAFELLKKHD